MRLESPSQQMANPASTQSIDPAMEPALGTNHQKISKTTAHTQDRRQITQKDWEDLQRDCSLFPAYTDYLYGPETRPEVLERRSLRVWDYAPPYGDTIRRYGRQKQFAVSVETEGGEWDGDQYGSRAPLENKSSTMSSTPNNAYKPNSVHQVGAPAPQTTVAQNPVTQGPAHPQTHDNTSSLTNFASAPAPSSVLTWEEQKYWESLTPEERSRTLQYSKKVMEALKQRHRYPDTDKQHIAASKWLDALLGQLSPLQCAIIGKLLHRIKV